MGYPCIYCFIKVFFCKDFSNLLTILNIIILRRIIRVSDVFSLAPFGGRITHYVLVVFLLDDMKNSEKPGVMAR